MKNLEHLFIPIAAMFLVLGMVGSWSRARQNSLFSNTKTPAPVSLSPGQSSSQTNSGRSGAPAGAVTDEEQTRTWKTYQYRSSGITFRYPQNLVLSQEGSRIKLRHSIKFKHLDSCDYSDNIKPLSRLVDFDVSFELVRKDNDNNRQSDESNEHSTATPDTADYGSITIGSLKGEFERLSVEGCGEYRYRFPLAGDQILVVQREIIGIFSPTAQKFVDEQIVLKQPGIISPEQEERLFNTILSTFKPAKAK
jgi:hypothetical protein